FDRSRLCSCLTIQLLPRGTCPKTISSHLTRNTGQGFAPTKPEQGLIPHVIFHTSTFSIGHPHQQCYGATFNFRGNHKMNILGIHAYHDSSAALVRNGKIIAAVDEERFNRNKHTGDFPRKSVECCLNMGNINWDDVDMIACAGSPSSAIIARNFQLDFQRLKEASTLGDINKLTVKDYLKSVGKSMLGKTDKLSLAGLKETAALQPDALPDYLTLPQIPDNARIAFVEHHMAHAASAFFTSGYPEEDTLLITADGIGGRKSLVVWQVQNNQIKELYHVGGNGSLGWFYGMVTEGLGWWVGDGEGKTMGLAPYGDLTKVPEEALGAFLPRYEDGLLVTPYEFGVPTTYQEGSSYHWHFKDSEKIKTLTGAYERADIAARAQDLLEQEMLNIIKAWKTKTKAKRLVTAGGLFLNVKLNQKIIEADIFDEYFIFPCPGDNGLSCGAALAAYYAEHPTSRSKQIRDVCWGPSYAPENIKTLLDDRFLDYEIVDDPCEVAAEELANGQIVGWFQGNMEYGPRALGSRSILMDPTKAENKDIINAKVKFREAFRPFCPSLKIESSNRFLTVERPERYMITAYRVREEEIDQIPAVVHKDGTCRPQLIEKDIYPRFWDLLDKFEQKTGVPVLLNTSFNIKGEPIVCNPREALRCFFDTGIEVLVMENTVMRKKKRI
ncbi:MAG: carbamoyltransferase C-terminal domain-containing protein, partial [Myxococcota bacterium]|nr:carbamoyltransferase C-terminal domain-containing protein [Myxococcota bacterium]